MRRITRKDMPKLVEHGFPILREDGRTDVEVDPQSWCTVVHGPADTPYAGGTWRVRFTFTAEYPFKSPSVGFVDRVWHPNIEWKSGSICLDSLQRSWSSTTALVSIVEALLPGLLAAPNPHDAFNAEAAAHMLADATAYDAEVRAAVAKYSYGSVGDGGGSGSGGSGGSGSGTL